MSQFNSCRAYVVMLFFQRSNLSYFHQRHHIQVLILLLCCGQCFSDVSVIVDDYCISIYIEYACWVSEYIFVVWCHSRYDCLFVTCNTRYCIWFVFNAVSDQVSGHFCLCYSMLDFSSC